VRTCDAQPGDELDRLQASLRPPARGR
jgi:hypothetical protein